MSTAQASRGKAEVAVGTGTEWVVDAYGCSEKQLQDLNLIQSLCQRIIDDLGVTVVGIPQLHRFGGPGGVTALYMLSESHLACHTYAEYGLATFNLYCCRERAGWDWKLVLAEVLGAENVCVRQLARGVSTGIAPLGSPEETESISCDRTPG